MSNAYAPPVYDEAAGMIVEPSELPPERGRPATAGRSGVSHGGGRGGDRYVALEADEVVDQAQIQTQRANDIALRRQREHAAAFQRQMQQEEDYAKSSAKQTARDAEIAAQLAAGGADSEGLAMDQIAQSQRDAELALRLQREMDAQQPNPQQQRRDQEPVQRRQKVVRVLVPSGAQAGDSLAVATPTTGKFEVKVPHWARPGQHFDCHVTTVVEVTPQGQRPQQQQQAQPTGYQPPAPDLPPGWERGMTPEGVPFYVDHNNRTTHWEPPTTTTTSTNATPTQQPPPPPPQQPPADVAPAGMTEEEMIAAAIALSLKESQGAAETESTMTAATATTTTAAATTTATTTTTPPPPPPPPEEEPQPEQPPPPVEAPDLINMENPPSG